MALHSFFHQATGKMSPVLLASNILSEVGLFLALVSYTGALNSVSFFNYERVVYFELLLVPFEAFPGGLDVYRYLRKHSPELLA
jgi:hypothetical protein